jgi:demethylmenaquinone methyltransferase / 2-methoxy-6-polyprenyl-1,4-benzoquinol methylase
LHNTQDPEFMKEKSRRVRDMFGSIAARYDFLNHFLSANLDRRWRQACVREMKNRNKASSPRILDVGCGTADLSVAFSGLGPVIGCDFCHPMLCLGDKKITASHSMHPINLIEADALRLPFPERTFDLWFPLLFSETWQILIKD